MTDSKPYFASHEAAVSPASVPGDAITATAVESRGVVVVKAPHPNSKLILQNMEEVLSTVREQHRQKHRRKKEQKKLAQMEAEAAAASPGNVELMVVKSNVQNTLTDDKRRRKKPLQDKSVQENGDHNAKSGKRKSKSPLQGGAPQNGSILHHFPRTPKKEDDDANVSTKVPTKPTNAFEVMMNARNKTVESQTPVKEPSISPTALINVSVSNTKRKLMLQDWADKKGAAKRKLDEESRAAYVEVQLEKRAKRFKKMLVNGSIPKGRSFQSDTNPDMGVDVARMQSSDDTPTLLEQATAKPKRGRGRRRPLDPLDSPQPMEVRTPDPETAEFLAKLSSPTKKRDSLLGYFLKKESPKEHLEATPNEVLSQEELPKKRKGRPPGKREVQAKETEPDVKLVVDADLNHTPGGRPRRSCAARARYDYDLQESPTKQEKPKGAVVGASKDEAVSTSDDVEIISLDDSSTPLSEIIAVDESHKKLAPLFVRSMPKPSVDHDALRARQQFLMSGVPEKLRLEQEKQRQHELKYEETLEPFPRVSHVLQLDTREQESLQQPIKMVFKLIPIEDSTANITPSTVSRRRKAAARHVKNLWVDKSSRAPVKSAAQGLSLSAIDNKRHIIKGWKSHFERFPTYKCYNQMREKYRHFSAVDTAQDTEQVSESFVVTRRTNRLQQSQKKFDPEAEDDKPPLTAPNGELLFTEKYKPMLLDQVLVNLSPVLQLRDFLATWCSGNGGGAASARSSQTLDDSMDFMNDSNSSQQATGNSVVLLGPGSSGKTNAVFALANEMNFNVLEINAGMRRTGKILMQELQEATQSHQIRKEPSTTSLGKAQKSLLKRSLSGLKARIQSPLLDKDGRCASPTNSEFSSSARKCLILIEDADIVFEQTDAGFADAICSLAACSKRPVIIVATDRNCAHLQRLMNQNTIDFAAPNALNTSKFLSILSLIENCPIRLDDLMSLYTYNRKDLRRTLLELQFFVQSGGDRWRGQVHLASQELQFFASPGKQRISAVESGAEQSQQPDEQLDKGVVQKRKNSGDRDSDAYMHRTLFEFYTKEQNANWRIPFPVDFRLLHWNISDVFQVAHKLQEKPQAAKVFATPVKIGNTKRKSRSPKKDWLSSAAALAETPKIAPLEALCEFYENISVAAGVGVRNDPDLFVPWNNAPPQNADRLVPYLAEYIAHDLVERAVSVNLEADSSPYNLFHSPSSKNIPIGDYFDESSSMRMRQARFLDYEPTLRTICRSEATRAMLDRRSTRFYHYLRNSCINYMSSFSMHHLDMACAVLQEQSAEQIDLDGDVTAASQ